MSSSMNEDKMRSDDDAGVVRTTPVAGRTGAAEKRVGKWCECGRTKYPVYALPGNDFGKRGARWCAECPTRPEDALSIGRRICECGHNYPSLGLPGERRAAAHWCDLCPTKPDTAVFLPGDIMADKTGTWQVHPWDCKCAQCPSVAAATTDTSARCECKKTRRPSWGLPDHQPRWCAFCPGKPAEAVDLDTRRCSCGRGVPCFGRPGEAACLATWCDRCPDRSAAAVRVRLCDCGRAEPRFGLRGELPEEARWCQSCPTRPDNALDKLKKRSASVRCQCGRAAPTMGLPGQKQGAGEWCANCPSKPAGAVNLVKVRCECGVSMPYFGLPGEPRNSARWCAKCPGRPAEAVDIKNKHCECGKSQPFFGLRGERWNAARWCGSCPNRPRDAVNVRMRRCECDTRPPRFGLPGDQKARWCASCPTKPAGAVVAGAAAKYLCSCGKSEARWGMPGDRLREAKWCSKCPTKPADAVNLKKRKH